MSTDVVCIMDDLAAIKPVKDTTLALLLEARRRDLPVWYANESDLSLQGGRCRARLRRVELFDDNERWFEIEDETERELGQGDLVLMRSDPPVDAGYMYATLILDRAAANGARVVNRPAALRDFNEKLAIAHFPDLIAATLVSSDAASLRRFVLEHERAVIKPLDGMGGRGVFLASADDPNLNVILETLTGNGTRAAMVQEYLPAIADGDNRILMIAGKPVPYVLARIPGADDFRGNLARGGQGRGRPINDAEQRIAGAVGPVLVENGIEFAGLDVIGDRLTEVNVTSPTCVRELDAQFGINIAGMLFDSLLRHEG